MKKLKILFLPSWYPTLENPFIGHFFKEQAEALSEDFDVKILFVSFKLTAKKKIFSYLVRNSVSEIQIIGNLTGKGYEVKLPPWVNKADKLKTILQNYEKIYCQYTNSFGTPDLIHAHGGLYAGIASTFLKEKYKVPNLITEHHPILVKDFELGFAKAYIAAFNDATATSTVSSYSQRMLMMQTEKTFPFIHGNLVNEEIYRNLNQKPKDFTIGYIGYPSFNKDPFTFLSALELLREKYLLDFKAKMVIPDSNGDFSFKDILQSIEKRGLRDIVEIIPGLDKNELVKFYNSLSILISTSYSETFGLVVAEAIACGVPVVATRSGGVEDFLDNSLGYLVNLKDYEKIAEHVLFIKENPFHFSATEMRQKVIKEFGKVAFKNKVAKIYKLILNKEQGN